MRAYVCLIFKYNIHSLTFTHTHTHTRTLNPSLPISPQDSFYKPNIELPVMLQEECIIGRKIWNKGPSRILTKRIINNTHTHTRTHIIE